MRATFVHLVFTGALLAGSAAQETMDLNRTTCKQLLDMKPDQILIVMGWLQGYYLEEHAPPIVDFDKFSADRRKLTEHCETNPEMDLMSTADMLFGK